MNLIRKIAVVIVALLASMVCNVSYATPITYIFGGSIPESNLPQGCIDFPDDLCGSTVAGYFTIDDQPIDEDQGRLVYESNGGPFGMFIDVGGLAISMSGIQIQIGNDIAFAGGGFDCEDDDLIFCDELKIRASGDEGSFFAQFVDEEGDAIDSNLLFPDPNAFGFDCWDEPECQLRFRPPSGVDGFVLWSNFNWTFFRSPVVIPVFPIPVPEPSTLALFTLGLLGLALGRKRAG